MVPRLILRRAKGFEPRNWITRPELIIRLDEMHHREPRRKIILIQRRPNRCAELIAPKLQRHLLSRHHVLATQLVDHKPMILADQIAPRRMREEPSHVLRIVHLRYAAGAKLKHFPNHHRGHGVEVARVEDHAHLPRHQLKPHLHGRELHQAGIGRSEIEPRARGRHDPREHSRLRRIQRLNALAVDDVAVALCTDISIRALKPSSTWAGVIGNLLIMRKEAASLLCHRAPAPLKIVASILISHRLSP